MRNLLKISLQFTSQKDLHTISPWSKSIWLNKIVYIANFERKKLNCASYCYLCSFFLLFKVLPSLFYSCWSYWASRESIFLKMLRNSSKIVSKKFCRKRISQENQLRKRFFFSKKQWWNTQYFDWSFNQRILNDVGFSWGQYCKS